MYQVFVVEDELLIRQSIRNMVESLPGPYAFCGEASDGEMALSMMQDLMPDILLTDIRMPFLDGFELIRHVRSMMPWIRIIIISGFGDFDYAQKAISLGANQYLLKPLRAPELTRAIEEVTRQIEQEKAASERLPSGYDQDELNHVLHQHFMHQLLGGSAETGVLLERARRLGLEVIRPMYQAVVFSFEGEGDNHRLHSAAMKLLSDLRVPLYYLNELDQLTLLVTGPDEDALTEEVYRLVNIVRHELKACSQVITTVVGTPVTRLSAVCDAYRKAKELLKSVSSIAPGQVIEADDTAQITAEAVSFSGPFGSDFQRRLLAAASDEVPALVHEYLNGENSDQFKSMLMRYYALVDILKMTVQIKLRADPGADSQELLSRLSSQYDLFGASGTRQGFETMAVQLLCDVAEARRSMPAAGKYPPVISRADAYVAEHYCDSSISLMSVAKHVGMSTAHFSTVFSQAHGTPFISYLTAMRIEKAKQLLAETDMKLSAIAMEIGYNEPNYFSHVFRKSEGITPKEYRQNMGRP